MTWPVLWLAASALTTSTILTGQLGLLLAIPATLAWRHARAGRWARAGAWCGIVMAAKLFALPVLLWLAADARRRAGILPAAAAVALCVAAGSLVFGWSAYVVWMRQFGGIDWAWAGMNASLPGVATRALAPSPLFTPVVHAPGAVAWVEGATGVLVLAVSLVCAHRADVDRAFAVLWSGCLLASPLGWVYYGWLLVGPAWALRRDRRLPVAPLFLTVLLLLVPPYLVTEVRASWWTVSFGSAYTFALLAFWMAALLATPPAGRRAAPLVGPGDLPA